MTDIFDRIREDHTAFRTLIELVGKTDGDSEGRRELFGKMADQVRTHAPAEERVSNADLLEHGNCAWVWGRDDESGSASTA